MKLTTGNQESCWPMLGPSASVFCGVSSRAGTTRPLSKAFGPTEQVELELESVGERQRCDWLKIRAQEDNGKIK